MDPYPLLRRSASSGGPIRSLHGSHLSLSSSQLNTSGLPIHDTFSALKGTDILRTSLVGGDRALLSTSASFHGSGISDLRATVMAQQSQLDNLIDKVAALLGAMHTEVINDVRNAGSDVGARIEEVRRAGLEIDRRLLELRQLQNLEGGLQGWLVSEVEKLQEELAGKMQESRERHICEMQGLQTSLDSKMRGLYERLDTLEDTTLRAAREEPTWQLAIDQSCASLREELSREVLRGACEPLWARVCQIEEQVSQVHGQALQATRASPALEEEAAHHRERLERAEAFARQQAAALERMEADVRNLRLAGSATKDLEAQSLEWQQKAEQRLQTSAAGEARLGILEQWRKRVEERLAERPAAQLGPLRERLSGLEHRLDTLCERVESAAGSVGTGGAFGSDSAALSQGGRVAAETNARLDELRARLDSLAASASEDSRHVASRLRELDVLGARLDGVEGAAEATRRELAELRGERRSLSLAQLQLSQSQPSMMGIVETRVMELESALENRVVELQHNLEDQISRRIVGNLRQELETQALQEELETRTQTDRGHARAFQEELEEQKTCFKRLLNELRQDLETRIGHVASSSSGAAASGGGAFGERVAAGAAQETAHHAVAVLGRRLEEQMGELVGERLARCDAAAAGCELCAKAVEERLQCLAEDLRRDLARESQHLRERELEGPAPAASADPAALAEEETGADLEAKPSLTLQDSRGGRAQGFVDGYLLERKVSRSLAGLEEPLCSQTTFLT